MYNCMICHSVYSKLSANLLNSTSETRVVGVRLGSVTGPRKMRYIAGHQEPRPVMAKEAKFPTLLYLTNY